MLKVLVDTAAWLALVNKRDFLHAPARRVMSDLSRQNAHLTTTEFVLIEVANALSNPAFRAQIIRFIDGLRSMPDLNVVRATSALLDDGWQLYRSRLDKEWSLTDCTSFVVMQQESISQASTSDHHFEQAGFVKLL